MKIIITLSTDNAAFEDDCEVSRILRELARNWEDYRNGNRSKLMDINGNAVGTVDIEEEV